jgi:hypothetical protein
VPREVIENHPDALCRGVMPFDQVAHAFREVTGSAPVCRYIPSSSL